MCCALTQDAVPEDQQKEELMESITKGNFTLRIMYEQLANIQKMGPVGQVMSMIPGMSNSDLFSQVSTDTIRYSEYATGIRIYLRGPINLCSPLLQEHCSVCCQVHISSYNFVMYPSTA